MTTYRLFCVIDYKSNFKFGKVFTISTVWQESIIIDRRRSRI